MQNSLKENFVQIQMYTTFSKLSSSCITSFKLIHMHSIGPSFATIKHKSNARKNQTYPQTQSRSNAEVSTEIHKAGPKGSRSNVYAGQYQRRRERSRDECACVKMTCSARMFHRLKMVASAMEGRAELTDFFAQTERVLILRPKFGWGQRVRRISSLDTWTWWVDPLVNNLLLNFNIYS